MTRTIIFIHGMFQNAKSWKDWESYFSKEGYECIAESWPLHEGEPRDLRIKPPVRLGDLRLQTVIDRYVDLIQKKGVQPIVVGHSVGGLVVQKLAEHGLIQAGVPIASVAPNRMLTFDWGFFRNSLQITNPVAGDEPFEMDADGFHQNFANTMDREKSDEAYERTATHDSRNVLRDCMLETGTMDLERVTAPLYFIGAAEDQIIPSSLCEKNAKAYGNGMPYREFSGRGHFICGQPGWEEVAGSVASWLKTLPI